MSIIFYNSLSRQKECFTPLHPDHVKMYVCGPTVYDRAHLGNARSAVVFDQLYRLLKAVYPRVTYARNITDVDDKINAASLSRGIAISQITGQTTQWYQDDMAVLGVLPPDVQPKATEHIEEMIQMILTLIEKGHAYIAQGHVLFRVSSFKNYGKLSGRSQEEILHGARVEVAPYKEDPSDFVLWKPSEAPLPGWDSPWGRGRPGWHIECSAMGHKHLGFPMDIHAGGHDLMFPHHENEIAQGESATGEQCTRYWLHNGMLTVDGSKMSKSSRNFVTMDIALNQAPGEVIRFALLSAHYRQNLDWNATLLAQSKQALDRFYQVIGKAESMGLMMESGVQDGPILKALCDDLNTPKAFAELHQMAGALNKDFERDVFTQFYAGGRLLGLFAVTAQNWFQAQGSSADMQAEDIEALISERTHAKASRGFARADEIRQELHAKGILLEDHKNGPTTWKRK